ncbi:MAG: GNAT family N-acetyltransferase [Planctomycetota bacterium]
MLSEIRIHPRTEEDLPSVLRLLVAEDVSPEGLDESAGFIVKDGNEVVGHLGIVLLGEGYAVMSHMVLDPRYRGRGLTNGLACHVESWVRARCSATLLGFTNRKTGMHWLEERGFYEVERRLVPERVRHWSLFGTPVISQSRAYIRPVIRGLLFVGRTNSGRTLVAEGLARRMAPPEIAIYSAGLTRSPVEPLAMRSLEAGGVDPRGLHAKELREIPLEEINVLISFDRSCRASLPLHSQAIHEIVWEIPDPKLEGAPRAAFDEAKDEIHKRLSRYFG